MTAAMAHLCEIIKGINDAERSISIEEVSTDELMELLLL